MTTRHLVILSGQGDTFVSLATPAQWTWINGPSPRLPIPLSWDEVEPETGRKVNVTRGSWENDRAIACQTNQVCFDTEEEARAHAQEQGWTVSDEQFDGYIY